MQYFYACHNFRSWNQSTNCLRHQIRSRMRAWWTPLTSGDVGSCGGCLLGRYRDDWTSCNYWKPWAIYIYYNIFSIGFFLYFFVVRLYYIGIFYANFLGFSNWSGCLHSQTVDLEMSFPHGVFVKAECIFRAFVVFLCCLQNFRRFYRFFASYLCCSH